MLDVKSCLKDRMDKSLVTVLCSSNKQTENNMLQNRAEYYMWVINFQKLHKNSAGSRLLIVVNKYSEIIGGEGNRTLPCRLNKIDSRETKYQIFKVRD